MSRRGAVIFDLDGTLVDSYQPITSALNAAREAFGLAPAHLENVRGQVGRGLEALLEEHLGVQRVEAGVGIFRSVYARIFADGTVPQVRRHRHPELQQLGRGRAKRAAALGIAPVGGAAAAGFSG